MSTPHTDWRKRFEVKFGAFAIMGKAGRLYNGAFANEARISEAIDFIEQELSHAVAERTEEIRKGLPETNNETAPGYANISEETRFFIMGKRAYKEDLLKLLSHLPAFLAGSGGKGSGRGR